ncbi:MAG: sulfatase [Halobacteriales archaeon]
MRILYVDCDSLRADHLGCYGYDRETSPTIDGLAADGRRFTNVYASDLPCLPSRTALFTGRFGIHTGVVNHGGLASEPRPIGDRRGFAGAPGFETLTAVLRDAGHYTASISPFPTRHGAWHVLDGFREWRDTGKGGFELAEEVCDPAIDWLQTHATDEDWFLHVNFWDAHTPYDTPVEYGTPFDAGTAPSFPDEETIYEQYRSYGPHSAQDLHGVGKTPEVALDWGEDAELPRTPAEIGSRGDFVEWIDAYDVGVRYMDEHIGYVLDVLREKGVFEDTLVIVSADHGENQGELNIYGDHHTADYPTGRIPLIVHGPDVTPGVDGDLHYHLDLAPTMVERIGATAPDRWDGQSFEPSLADGDSAGRETLVLSQAALTCQRGVRWGDWLLLRTYHDGVKDVPEVALYDLVADPHQTRDLSDERPGVTAEGIRRLEAWHADRMAESSEDRRGGNPDPPTGLRDPLWTVINEGGPFHTTQNVPKLERYLQRLRDTDRAHHADQLAEQYADLLEST